MKRCQKTTCFIGALGAVKNNEIIRREKGLKMKNKRYRKLHRENLIFNIKHAVKKCQKMNLKDKNVGDFIKLMICDFVWL